MHKEGSTWETAEEEEEEEEVLEDKKRLSCLITYMKWKWSRKNKRKITYLIGRK
jgi:hypothetical protein